VQLAFLIFRRFYDSRMNEDAVDALIASHHDGIVSWQGLALLGKQQSPYWYNVDKNVGSPFQAARSFCPRNHQIVTISDYIVTVSGHSVRRETS
jgi:hypothetical protein